jgi:8-oxo-dGTP diphosphatase
MRVESLGFTCPTLAGTTDKATTVLALFAHSGSGCASSDLVDGGFRIATMSTMSTTPDDARAPWRIRQAARALVMDREHRVLLVHFDFYDDYHGGLWACPGGGLDVGESLHDGVIRELAEETGLVADDPGEPIWTKHHLVALTNWDGQHDTYFLFEVDNFVPRPAFTGAELLAEHVDGIRWWDYDELRAAQAAYDAGDTSDPAYAVFSPRLLGHHVADLVERGRPATSIDVSSDAEGPNS